MSEGEEKPECASAERLIIATQADSREEETEIPQEDLPEFHPLKIRVAAGFMLRVPALLIDAIVLTFLAGLVQGIFLIPLEAMGPRAWLAGFWLSFFFFFLMSSPLTRGRSPGKRLLQLYLIDEKGTPPGWGHAALRGLLLATVLNVPSLVQFAGHVFSPAQGLLLFMVLFTLAAWLLNGSMMDPLKQAWHDRVCGLYVIQREGLERFTSGGWHNEIWPRKGRLRKKMNLLALGVAVFYTLLFSGFFLPFLPRDKNGFLLLGPLTLTPQGTAVTRYLYWQDNPKGGVLAEDLRRQPGVLETEVFFTGIRQGFSSPTRRGWLVKVRLQQKAFDDKTFRKKFFAQVQAAAGQLYPENAAVDVIGLSLMRGPNLGIAHNLTKECIFEKPVWSRRAIRFPKTVFTQDFCLGPPTRVRPSFDVR